MRKKRKGTELHTTLSTAQNNYTVTSQTNIEQQNYDKNRDNGQHVQRQGEKEDTTGKIGHVHIHRYVQEDEHQINVIFKTSRYADTN
jgi:hypothetical protein